MKTFCLLRSSLYLGVFLCSMLLASACGGSSDDDTSDGGDSGGDEEFSLDACEAIGLAKVANGHTCSYGSNPAVSPIVKLTIYDPFGSAATCTGVAISSNAILTAGHCFSDGYIGVSVDTFVGSYTASSAVLHPNFDITGSGDETLLVNDSAIVFTDTTLGIGTAPLLISRAPSVGEEAVVSGFGETYPGSGATDTVYVGNALITGVSSQHVTIRYTGDQAHPCGGDSGGPLLVSVGGTMAIVGTVSQSDPSVELDNICRPGDMTLYASVQDSSIYSFIASYVPGASGI